MEPYTPRIWAKTLATLRLVAALTGTSLVRVMERWATEALERLERQREKERQTTV